jgi:hypothetical protein
MQADLEQRLLLWINDEVSGAEASGHAGVASTQLLAVRLAMESDPESAKTTLSTKISLQTFERATLFRGLRALQRKELVQFCSADGAALAELSPQEEPPHVMLSKKGKQELLRLLKLRQMGQI